MGYDMNGVFEFLASPMTEYFKHSKTYYMDQINLMFKEQLYSSVLSFVGFEIFFFIEICCKT